ncbi:MAG: HAD-IA family hydrolase, partial [Actinobacteria bacterium]|nr:HAD-IA family hydrolase [Actinomycetota bacterium]
MSSLDAVSAEWRIALDSARHALRDAADVGVAAGELRAHARRLARECTETAAMLDELAAVERVHLLHPLSAPPPSHRLLGLPEHLDACVFDLEGVLVGSARVHAAAWTETFDEFLPRWAERGRRAAPISGFTERDYRDSIHGRPRLEGVQTFLASRGIRLPQGKPTDAPGAPTVWGLANRKAEAFRRLIDDAGVPAYAGAQLYLERVREAGLRCAVVTASANASRVIARAGLDALVEFVIDGDTMREEHLRSKPAPDTLVVACERLGIPPAETAAFETTAAGVDAAKAAKLGYVVAVDRHGL